MSQAGIIDVIGTNPEIPTLFVTDNGSAIPIANTIEILGSTVTAHGVPIETTGSGSTVTVVAQYASSGASSVGANAGFSSFDSAYFTVDANGFVSFTGSSGTESFNVDTSTAPGTDPVVPDGSGIITVTGGQVAAGTTGNVIRTNSLAANTYTIQIQRSQAVASSTIGDNGVSHFNSTYFTVDANGFVSINGSSVGQTITGNTGGALSPTAGNWNILGATSANGTIPVQFNGATSTLTLNVQRSAAIASTAANRVGLAAFDSSKFGVDANGFVTLNATPDLHGPKYIVGDTSNGANYSTIAAAITAAPANAIIYIQEGTYVENLTITQTIYFASLTQNDHLNNSVTVDGQWSINAACNLNISGIGLTNASGSIISTTTTSAQANISSCFINVQTGTGISQNATGSNIYLINCEGVLQTGTQLCNVPIGNIWIWYTQFGNNGSQTASSIGASGNLSTRFSSLDISVTTSSTGGLDLRNTRFGSGQNVTWITTAGTFTGNVMDNCSFYSGSASAISIGSGTAITATKLTVNSSNTNAITGAGTITYGGIIYSGTSILNNVTTKNPIPWPTDQGGTGLSSYTTGNLLYASATNVLSKLAIGSTNDVLTVVAGAPSWQAATASSLITTFTSGSGTWTINAKTVWVKAFLWGGGGSGGSGRKGTTAAAGGGGGGAPGEISVIEGPASVFTGGLSYTVAAATTGGASQTTDATNGNPGSFGNSTTLGSIVALGGNAGSGGTATTSTGGALIQGQQNFGVFLAASVGVAGGGGTAANPPNLNPVGSVGNGLLTAGGGAGGSGGNSVTPQQAPSGSAQVNANNTILVAAAAGGIASGTINGANANAPYAAGGMFGSGLGGGGGGGSNGVLNGGNGGNGSAPSGGGAGGGGGISTATNSGAGGNGAPGQIVIIEYF